MRSLIYRVSQLEGYNLSSAYGLSDECTKIPFACLSGTRAFITYGHVRDPFTATSQKKLRIMMIRDPLSWLFSRIQHEIRKTKSSSLTATSAIVQFGPKYFNFLPDDLRSEVMQWFNRLVKPAAIKSTVKVSPPSGLLNRVETELRDSIFVLSTEHYQESLGLLSFAFDSKHFQPTDTGGDNSKNFPMINEAFDWQQSASAATYAEMKQLSRLLEAHNAIHQLALREFFRQQEELSK